MKNTNIDKFNELLEDEKYLKIALEIKNSFINYRDIMYDINTVNYLGSNFNLDKTLIDLKYTPIYNTTNDNFLRTYKNPYISSYEYFLQKKILPIEKMIIELSTNMLKLLNKIKNDEDYKIIYFHMTYLHNQIMKKINDKFELELYINGFKGYVGENRMFLRGPYDNPFGLNPCNLQFGKYYLKSVDKDNIELFKSTDKGGYKEAVEKLDDIIKYFDNCKSTYFYMMPICIYMYFNSVKNKINKILKFIDKENRSEYYKSVDYPLQFTKEEKDKFIDTIPEIFEKIHISCIKTKQKINSILKNEIFNDYINIID